jgi:hypothetical protein
MPRAASGVAPRPAADCTGLLARTILAKSKRPQGRQGWKLNAHGHDADAER